MPFEVPSSLKHMFNATYSFNPYYDLGEVVPQET